MARTFDDFIADYENTIASAMQELLERKHLYQSVTVSRQKLLNAHRPTQAEDFSKLYEVADQYSAKWWALSDTGRRVDSPRRVHCRMPKTVRTYCVQCEDAEPFNLITAADLFYEDEVGAPSSEYGERQLFVVTYQCQSCKDMPDALLVRRDGDRITLCGRAPMEGINTPRHIPKTVKGFLEGAIVAHQSGQTLAGNFLLRVTIEQWARSQATRTVEPTGDDVMTAYMETLPDDFKGRFPSLRDLYSKLSADIHGATGDAQLFEDAAKIILGHFDARRVFQIASK